jgi:hypothetical protein
MNTVCLSEKNLNNLLKYALKNCSNHELPKNHTNFLNFMINPISDTSTKVCSPGYYRDDPTPWIDNSSTCKPCPPGSYSSMLDAYQCTECPPGYYSKQGSGECTKCQPGFYSKQGSSKCTKS